MPSNMNEFIKILPAVFGLAYIARQVALRWNDILHPSKMEPVPEPEFKSVQSLIDGRKIPFTHYTFYTLYLDNQGIADTTAIKIGHERRFGQVAGFSSIHESFATEAFNEDLLKAAAEYLGDRWTYSNFMN